MNGQVETEYRHIVKEPAIAGGAAMIRGTRIPVRAIVGYYQLGMSVEEILEGLPHLTPGQVFEALSYYHDNATEISRESAENQKDALLKRFGLRVGANGRLESVE